MSRRKNRPPVNLPQITPINYVAGPPPPNDFHVEVSPDLGRTWSKVYETCTSFAALRYARTDSGADAEDRLFRVINIKTEQPLLHFRRGVSVMSERNWE